jgi:predicted amino acid-binding ACT domain protein
MRLCQATFYMLDAPGACAAISRFLGERNIDILNSVSLSMISDVCMVWKMLIDLSYYGDEEELLSEFERMKSESSTQLEKVDALEVEPSRISERYTKGVAPASSSVRTKMVRKLTKKPSRIDEGWFEIPQEHLEMFEGLEEGQPLMMVGDTDSWVLSITFLKPETELVEIGFVIPDRPGAIKEVTQELAAHDINLLSVYTKVLVYYEKMTLVVVADVSRCPLEVEELRSSLENFVASFGGRYELASFEEIDF